MKHAGDVKTKSMRLINVIRTACCLMRMTALTFGIFLATKTKVAMRTLFCSFE